MKQNLRFLADALKKQDIRLSRRRLKVLEYLYQSADHPSADQIYGHLRNEIPGLSRTTVYNTLHTLIKAGLVKAIAIEDIETRYELVTKDHGHFKCVECGAIFDFGMDFDALTAEGLDGYKIVDRNVYFKGVCPGCLSEINHNI